MFLLAPKFGECRFRLGGEGLLHAVGGRDKLIQAAEAEESGDVAQAGIVRLDKDHVEGHEQTLEEFQAVRRVTESNDATGETAGLAALLVLLKAVPEGTVGHTEFEGNLPTRLPPEADALSPCDDLGLATTPRAPGFPAKLLGRKLIVGIHGLGSFNGFFP